MCNEGLRRENKINYLRINPYLSTISGALLGAVYHEVTSEIRPSYGLCQFSRAFYGVGQVIESTLVVIPAYRSYIS